MTFEVINQLESKSSFAINVETGEQVFIGSRVSKLQNLKEGDIIDAMVVPNDRNPSVAWYAIHVRKVSAPEPEPELGPGTSELKDAVCDFLRDGPATTRQVAEHLDIETSEASSALSCMHRYGLVARSGVRKRGDQKSDSYVIWARAAEEFLPEEEEHV